MGIAWMFSFTVQAQPAEWQYYVDEANISEGGGEVCSIAESYLNNTKGKSRVVKPATTKNYKIHFEEQYSIDLNADGKVDFLSVNYDFNSLPHTIFYSVNPDSVKRDEDGYPVEGVDRFSLDRIVYAMDKGEVGARIFIADPKVEIIEIHGMVYVLLQKEELNDLRSKAKGGYGIKSILLHYRLNALGHAACQFFYKPKFAK